MKRYVAYKDLSKKEKKKRDREKRVTWEGKKPVTRVKESKKLYSRKKRKKDDMRLMNEEPKVILFLCLFLSESIILDSRSYMRKNRSLTYCMADMRVII